MTDPVLWQLTPERVGEWRSIRLAALKDSPGIFLGDWADWNARPDADFLPRLIDSDCWAAGAAVGHPLAVARWAPHGSLPDTGMLMSVFARPQARGTGATDALIGHLLTRATGHVARMVLHVATANAPAIRLYQRLGFRPTDRPPEVNQSGIVEIEMARPLP